jgi:hypothetical protein
MLQVDLSRQFAGCQDFAQGNWQVGLKLFGQSRDEPPEILLCQNLWDRLRAKSKSRPAPHLGQRLLNRRIFSKSDEEPRGLFGQRVGR